MRVTVALRRGFTIVELALVLTILAILSIAAVASLSSRSARLDVAARRLKSDLQAAQELAMTQSGVYGFRALGSASYEIFEGTPGTPALEPLTRQPFIVDMLALYRGISFATQPPQVAFDRDGSPTIVGPAEIRLTDGASSRRLFITPNTGLIQGP